MNACSCIFAAKMDRYVKRTPKEQFFDKTAAQEKNNTATSTKRKVVITSNILLSSPSSAIETTASREPSATFASTTKETTASATTLETSALTKTNTLASAAIETPEVFEDDYNSSDSYATDVEGTKSHKRKRTAFRQMFLPKWKNEFKWLDSKDGKGYCTLCMKTLANNKTNIERHGKGNTHTKNESCLKNQPHIGHNENMETFQSKLRNVKIAELKIIAFICVHNLPFTLITPLIELIKSIAVNPEVVKDIKCARTKATETVNGILCEDFGKLLCEHLRNNKFSLIIDEATDVSTTKCLALVARFFDSQLGKIRDRFIRLIEVDKSDAVSLFSALKTFFEQFKIPKDNLVGFSADNARVMMGENTGVQTQLKCWNKHLFVMGCVCHSMHLCASAAAKNIPADVEMLVRDIYLFFAHSSKRQKEFKEFQEYFDLKKHNILKKANTRWLSLEKAIDRILEQWTALGTYFSSHAFESNNDIALNILSRMNAENKCYFLFLASALKDINKINLEFQAVEPRFHILLKSLKLYFKNILNNFININAIDIEAVNTINFEQQNIYKPIKDIYLGPQAQMFIQKNLLTNENINRIKTHCQKFYITVCKEILQRINFDEPVMKAVEILDPESLGESLVPLLTIFPNLVSCERHMQELESEWRLLILNDFLNKEDKLDTFWQKIFKMKTSLGDPMYPNLKAFIPPILSLPHSSASTERIFSQMKIIKTPLRNCLKVETVNSILLVKEVIPENDLKSWTPSSNIIASYKA